MGAIFCAKREAECCLGNPFNIYELFSSGLFSPRRIDCSCRGSIGLLTTCSPGLISKLFLETSPPVAVIFSLDFFTVKFMLGL